LGVRTLGNMIDNAGAAGAQSRRSEGFATLSGRVVGPVVARRTWLATIHLLAGLPIGIAIFVVAVTGVALGIGLLPLFLVGVAVLVATSWVIAAFARFERARFSLLLGESIQPPPVDPRTDGWWQRFLRRLKAPSTWKQVAYCILRLPVGIVDFTFALTIWSLALALITLPAYNSFLPQGGVAFGGLVIDNVWLLAGAFVVGVVLLLLAPILVRGLADVETLLARALLGPGKQSPLLARVSELEHSRARAVDGAAAERVRMERDLHDGAQQRLVSLAMELGRAKAKFDTDPEGARNLIDRAHAEAKEALVELRDLVRGVHPPVLSDRGLDAALSGLAALSPIPVTVTVDLQQRPSLTIESIAYFVVAESLANVAKHANAHHASVAITRTSDTLHVTVRDDGSGGADPAGKGLAGLADRVSGVDGRLAIDSPPGGPTVVAVELPCGS
jgi:signal transduction histidine kinase